MEEKKGKKGDKGRRVREEERVLDPDILNGIRIRRHMESKK